MQIKYATDIVFYQQRYLQTMHDTLTRITIHTVKPKHIATFQGNGVHVKKGIYSLVPLQDIFSRANHRYLKLILACAPVIV